MSNIKNVINKKRTEDNRKKSKADLLNREWYSGRSLFGNDWAIFFFLLGGREAGKSYDITEMFTRQFIKFKRPFYWLRLSETAQKKLLANNAEKLVDPDIRRKYNLDLVTKGDAVYRVLERDEETGTVKKKILMARVLCLATFYNDKGSGLFDKDFLKDPNMYYNIALDEFQREEGEKKSFDILYSFTNQLENLVRSTKKRIRVVVIGNTLAEASELLCAFNFIPEEFGRYYLKKKRCVIEYIEPSQKYLERRKGTIADILMPTASTFTNKVNVDDTLVFKGRLTKPNYVIKFSKELRFTVWDNNVISKYQNEKVKNIAMLPYLDEIFDKKARDQIFETFNMRGYRFRDLITFKQFETQLGLIRSKQ